MLPADDTSHTPRRDDLAHLPGSAARWPLVSTLQFLADPLESARRHYGRFGPVFRNRTFGVWKVGLFGPEANEFVLTDKERIFSSKHGWNHMIERLFPRGLMLLDFDEHRAHRRILSVAFRSAAMEAYLSALNQRTEARVKSLPVQVSFQFYPQVKRLLLDLAATSFLGLEWGERAETINRAFVDMVAGSIGIVRRPVPGTAMWRGTRGRKVMEAYFAAEIPLRRDSPRRDLFTHLCNVKDDEGRGLSPREIMDHMIFMMMASHDTLASALTSTVHFIAHHQDWQQRLREEVCRIRERNAGSGLQHGQLKDLPLTEMFFKEAVRLNPPVPGIPRRALREFEFQGFRIPAGTFVGINPLFTHRMPQVWPDPERFDPLRFTPENSQSRHRYAWVPFGGGPHMCLGMAFAIMEAKAFIYQLLPEYRIHAESRSEFRYWPMPKPKDGLPIRLEKV